MSMTNTCPHSLLIIMAVPIVFKRSEKIFYYINKTNMDGQKHKKRNVLASSVLENKSEKNSIGTLPN